MKKTLDVFDREETKEHLSISSSDILCFSAVGDCHVGYAILACTEEDNYVCGTEKYLLSLINRMLFFIREYGPQRVSRIRGVAEGAKSYGIYNVSASCETGLSYIPDENLPLFCVYINLPNSTKVDVGWFTGMGAASYCAAIMEMQIRGEITPDNTAVMKALDDRALALYLPYFNSKTCSPEEADVLEKVFSEYCSGSKA